MQVVESQQSVELSWALQSALAAGITVACAGVTVTFKRPAMRALTAAFVFITLAAATIWAALTASTAGLPDEATTILISLALPLTPVLTFQVYRQMIHLLSGRATAALPPLRILIFTGGSAFAIVIAIAVAAAGRGAMVIGLVGTVATLLALGTLTVLARRARKFPGARTYALKLLELSFAAFALRSMVNVTVAAAAVFTGSRPTFTLGTTLAQAFLLVMGAVLQLVAVLDEERAHSIAQSAQLLQAEVAIAASQRLESLGRMAGIVAHDFNNVLSVISMSAQSAMDLKGVGTEDDLAEIDASAKRGQALTAQLLAFARQAPQQVSRFDANVQLDKLKGLLHRVARHANLNVAAGGPPLLIEMDSTQFDQIVMNLVVNARDATPPGGTITVQLVDSAPDMGSADASTQGGRGGFAKISVIDTGSGISPDVLPHIFEPFFTTKKAADGTGLGLATCDGIVRRIGGRIDVTSTIGKGTRFDVLIPRATA